MSSPIQAASENPAPQPKFTIGRTIDGYEVVDEATGRPLSDVFETPQQANGHAQALNGIARSGNMKALARALRSI